MIKWLICGVFILIFLLYLVKRKPIWMKQITPQGKEVIFCSHCGEIWTPMQYEVFPPDRCPHCGKEMKTYI